jgi:hypothetical protein
VRSAWTCSSSSSSSKRCGIMRCAGEHLQLQHCMLNPPTMVHMLSGLLLASPADRGACTRKRRGSMLLARSSTQGLASKEHQHKFCSCCRCFGIHDRAWHNHAWPLQLLLGCTSMLCVPAGCPASEGRTLLTQYASAGISDTSFQSSSQYCSCFGCCLRPMS